MVAVFAALLDQMAMSQQVAASRVLLDGRFTSPLRLDVSPAIARWTLWREPPSMNSMACADHPSHRTSLA
jgi:hypothetical protein